MVKKVSEIREDISNPPMTTFEWLLVVATIVVLGGAALIMVLK